jgi:hypothetical protein
MGRPRMPRLAPLSSRTKRVSTPARPAFKPAGTIEIGAKPRDSEDSSWFESRCHAIAPGSANDVPARTGLDVVNERYCRGENVWPGRSGVPSVRSELGQFSRGAPASWLACQMNNAGSDDNRQPGTPSC